MKRREEILSRARSDIEKFGYHVIRVFEDETGPPFAYTVGLLGTYRHPEVLIVGTELTLAHNILASVVAEVARGVVYRAGDRSPDVLERDDVMFIDVLPSFHDELGVARDIDGAALRALQCVCPDRNGRFPWDEGCDAAYHRSQTLFGAPLRSMSTSLQ